MSSVAELAEVAEEAARVVAALGLQRHPEGGWFAETFRDPAPDGRSHSTAIYFLLAEGEQSAWHRVRHAAEVWHHYAGAALELEISPDLASKQRLVLGTDLAGGERPQHIVPANWWQRARSLGAWTLVGCTVAPGFEFEHFEMWQGEAPCDRPGGE
jgi:predicted cupin superfamily sugar epimerase